MKHFFVLFILMFVLMPSMAQAQDENAEMIDALMAVVEPLEFQNFLSQSGEHAGIVTIYPCTEIDGVIVSYERLDIVDTETDETVMVDEQFIYCGGLGAYGLLILRWTEGYLYYTDSRDGQPDGAGGISRARLLYRYSITEGNQELLGQGMFSPDGSWIILTTFHDIRVLPSRGTGEMMFNFADSDLFIVDVIPLPDSSGILVIEAETPYESTQSSVTHIDFETREQTVILTTEG